MRTPTIVTDTFAALALATVAIATVSLATVSFATIAPAQRTLEERVNRALDQARPALLEHLGEAIKDRVGSGELALLLLAAIHDGVSPTEAAMAQGMRALGEALPERTYDLALRLMVLEVSPNFPTRLALARRDTELLLRNRVPDGPFSYMANASDWDLSNTQYGALGLRAAQAIGVTVDRVVWVTMSEEVAAQQSSYGGFGYHKRFNSKEDYASMTAAGIAVLAICRQHLASDGAKMPELDRLIDRGWQWFGRHPDVIGSPKERWSYYFHYGLERAAILCDRDKVGGVDWYARGALMLTEAQSKGGGWKSRADDYVGTELSRGRGSSVPTAFAVLFLRRKFQKNAGPITPHLVTLAAVGPMAKQTDIDACIAGLVLRDKLAMPDVLWALRSEVAPRRQAAAAALDVITGSRFGYDAARDSKANRDAVRKAELWYLKNR